MKTKINLVSLLIVVLLSGCVSKKSDSRNKLVPQPDFIISADQTHNKFSRSIPPAIRVPIGSVIEASTHEATGGQLDINSTIEDVNNLDFDKIHTLTGPIYIEGAEVGDVLAVELLEIEAGDWGWTIMDPIRGFLKLENTDPILKTFELDKEENMIHFAEGIDIPIKPFAGVMGVAPNTDSLLNTIPPRANGGNMDDPNLVEGTTVYFPVFVEGALFSIGDPHAAQGLGEVCGTAVEAPMRFIFSVNIIKNKNIQEPQYETDEYYATTGFGLTTDEAARKATKYMADYIAKTYGLTWEESYMLCSLSGDLKIAEVVDSPNMLVTMHLPKSIFINGK